MPDDYEIMSRSELGRLKQEVANLRKSPAEGNLADSINDLKASIGSLMSLFQTAAEEIKREEAEQEGVEKRLGPLIRKVDTLMEQNQEIARGLVVIADMVKEHLQKKEEKQAPKQMWEQKPKMDYTAPMQQPWAAPPIAQQGSQQAMFQQPKPSPQWQQPYQQNTIMPPPPPKLESSPFDDLPPLGDTNLPPLEEPDFAEPKKKGGLLGMFKK